jgi:hypothetical protein
MRKGRVAPGGGPPGATRPFSGSLSDQYRSHGVVDLLQWYHNNVERDARIAQAVRRYADLLADPERSAYLTEHPIGLCLAGRAIATIIRPGVDCNRWKDSAR